MTSDDDKFWNDVAGKLRKLKGLCPPTPEEAETAFAEAPDMPLSDEQVNLIVKSVTSGTQGSGEAVPDGEWCDDPSLDGIDEETMQLFRNKGDQDAETEQIENALEQELLSDEAEEDESGTAGGTTPPGGGQ